MVAFGRIIISWLSEERLLMALSVLEEHSLVLHNMLPLEPGRALQCHPVPLACSKHSGRIYVDIQTSPPHCLLEVSNILALWPLEIKQWSYPEFWRKKAESERVKHTTAIILCSTVIPKLKPLICCSTGLAAGILFHFNHKSITTLMLGS